MPAFGATPRSMRFQIQMDDPCKLKVVLNVSAKSRRPKTTRTLRSKLKMLRPVPIFLCPGPAPEYSCGAPIDACAARVGCLVECSVAYVRHLTYKIRLCHPVQLVAGGPAKLPRLFRGFEKRLITTRIMPRRGVTWGLRSCCRDRWTKPWSSFKSVSDLEPGNAKLHENLGRALLRKRLFWGAVVHFKEALKLKPGDPALESELKMAQHALNH